jgi:hypothetical protein
MLNNNEDMEVDNCRDRGLIGIPGIINGGGSKGNTGGSRGKKANEREQHHHDQARKINTTATKDVHPNNIHK